MKCSSRPCLAWLVAGFLLLLVANLYVFLTRGFEDSYYPSNYATLNYPTDTPTLREWQVESGNRLRPVLVWNQTPDQWQLYVDGVLTQTMPGTDPVIQLAGAPLLTLTNTDADFHTYTLRPLPRGIGLDLTFSILAVDPELYRKGGQAATHVTYTIHTDVPVGKFQRFSVSHWADDYSYVDAKDLAEADRIVQHDMGITPSDDTITRMDKVFTYLKSVGIASAGVPRDDYRWMNPYAIFQEIAAGTGHGWCTQNAQIFVFFANRAGVPTRFVFGCNNQDDTIYYNGHSWAECYVKEKGRWTYVDVTESILGVSDRHGVPLNTADIYQMVQHDSFDGVTANVFKDWNWPKLPYPAKPRTAITVPFRLVDVMAKEEYNTMAILKYRRPPDVEDIRGDYSMLLKDRTFAWTNIKRYLFDPPLAYSNLQTDGVHTYCMRRSLFYALAAVFVLMVIAFFRGRCGRASGE